MRYVMKQKLWAWGDDFTIKDENGQDRFYVDGKAFSLGDQLSFQDMQHNELAYIKQKLLSWGPTYEIWHHGQLFAVVKEHLWSFMKYRFTVDVNADGPSPDDIEIAGNFSSHEYAFTRGGRQVAQVSMKWFSWADTYGVDVSPGTDDVLILACTVVVDMATQKHDKNS
jgi:uncharacterized protein YxjI